MKWKSYIEERKGLLILLLWIIVFPGMVIAVSEKESFLESNGCYAMVVSMILTLIYVAWDFRKRKQYDERLERLLGEKDIHFFVQLPEADTIEQKLYEKLIKQLDINYDSLLNELKIKSMEDMDFTENWVHEIKTPIAAMKLIIENGLDEPDEKVLFELSDQIVRIEDMVQKTICYNQINDLSRDCQIGLVNLGQVLNKCLRMEYANIHHKHIQLEMENLDFEVNSDEKWLYFMIKQVLDNAIKYSSENGRIKVYGKNEMNHQELVIEDFGVGIKMEDKRRLFEKGFTGTNGRAKVGATGVGLYLAYKLAKKLGHQIQVESEFGKGTKVSIILSIR